MEEESNGASNEGSEKYILNSILKVEPAESLIGWEQREKFKMIINFYSHSWPEQLKSKRLGEWNYLGQGQQLKLAHQRVEMTVRHPDRSAN